MAHKVTFTVPERELGKSDMEFKVRRDGEVLGTLKISKGNIVWVPKDAQKGYKINWAKFAEYAVENGRKEK